MKMNLTPQTRVDFKVIELNTEASTIQLLKKNNNNKKQQNL